MIRLRRARPPANVGQQRFDLFEREEHLTRNFPRHAHGATPISVVACMISNNSDLSRAACDRVAELLFREQGLPERLSGDESRRPRPLEVESADAAIAIQNLAYEIQTGTSSRLHRGRIDFLQRHTA